MRIQISLNPVSGPDNQRYVEIVDDGLPVILDGTETIVKWHNKKLLLLDAPLPALPSGISSDTFSTGLPLDDGDEYPDGIM